MLEKHTVPWIEEWGVGFGLMGEQGAESIHRYFNRVKADSQTIADDAQRLHCMMKEHFIHVAPPNVALQPEIKIRKRQDS